MKHTKGPWETPGTDGGARVISCRHHGRRLTLAHVYETGKAGAMEANATLMAAAPDLLEACKLALGFTAQDDLNEDDDEIADVQAALIHAITKATQEAQS